MSEPKQLQVQNSAAPATTEATRAATEVQASIIMAIQNPRDEIRARDKILTACKRPGLADQALYAYRRGGQMVSGPSIRLAETMARYWGNLSFGIKELEQRDGESVMKAFCWDLETNVREEREFVVPHVRHTKNGKKELEDPRDIYEMTANMGARRLRSCILSIIPGDIADEAKHQAETTMQGASDEPIEDRARKMVTAFKEFGVTQEMIEKNLGHKLTAITPTQLGQLRQIFQSMKDGASGREQWFDVGVEETSEAAEELNKAAEGEK